MSKALSRERSRSGSITERLLSQKKQKDARMEKLKEKYQQQYFEKEGAQLTFHPNIDKVLKQVN